MDLTGRLDRFEGYDESKPGDNPSCQHDFDADETDINQRKDEYKKLCSRKFGK